MWGVGDLIRKIFVSRCTMSEHMKRPLTKEVRIKISKNKEKLFLVPSDKVNGIIKLLSDYETDDLIPWRDAFKEEINKSSESSLVIKGYRVKNGMTQKDLAKKLKTSQPNIAALENGSRAVGKEMARKLAKIFKTDFRIFL